MEKRGIQLSQVLRQAWWAPLAGLLAIAELVVAVGFFTSSQDAASVAVGATLAVAGAVALVAGLLKRPVKPRLGDSLIIVGAALAAMWFWAIAVTPVAIIVIIGVFVSQMRTSSRDAKTT